MQSFAPIFYISVRLLLMTDSEVVVSSSGSAHEVLRIMYVLPVQKIVSVVDPISSILKFSTTLYKFLFTISIQTIMDSKEIFKDKMHFLCPNSVVA